MTTSMQQVCHPRIPMLWRCFRSLTYIHYDGRRTWRVWQFGTFNSHICWEASNCTITAMIKSRLSKLGSIFPRAIFDFQFLHILYGNHPENRILDTKLWKRRCSRLQVAGSFPLRRKENTHGSHDECGSVPFSNGTAADSLWFGSVGQNCEEIRWTKHSYETIMNPIMNQLQSSHATV